MQLGDRFMRGRAVDNLNSHASSGASAGAGTAEDSAQRHPLLLLPTTFFVPQSTGSVSTGSVSDEAAVADDERKRDSRAPAVEAAATDRLGARPCMQPVLRELYAAVKAMLLERTPPALLHFYMTFLRTASTLAQSVPYAGQQQVPRKVPDLDVAVVRCWSAIAALNGCEYSSSLLLRQASLEEQLLLAEAALSVLRSELCQQVGAGAGVAEAGAGSGGPSREIDTRSEDHQGEVSEGDTYRGERELQGPQQGSHGYRQEYLEHAEQSSAASLYALCTNILFSAMQHLHRQLVSTNSEQYRNCGDLKYRQARYMWLLLHFRPFVQQHMAGGWSDSSRMDIGMAGAWSDSSGMDIGSATPETNDGCSPLRVIACLRSLLQHPAVPSAAPSADPRSCSFGCADGAASRPCSAVYVLPHVHAEWAEISVTACNALETVVLHKSAIMTAVSSYRPTRKWVEGVVHKVTPATLPLMFAVSSRAAGEASDGTSPPYAGSSVSAATTSGATAAAGSAAKRVVVVDSALSVDELPASALPVLLLHACSRVGDYALWVRVAAQLLEGLGTALFPPHGHGPPLSVDRLWWVRGLLCLLLKLKVPMRIAAAHSPSALDSACRPTSSKFPCSRTQPDSLSHAFQLVVYHLSRILYVATEPGVNDAVEAAQPGSSAGGVLRELLSPQPYAVLDGLLRQLIADAAAYAVPWPRSGGSPALQHSAGSLVAVLTRLCLRRLTWVGSSPSLYARVAKRGFERDHAAVLLGLLEALLRHGLLTPTQLSRLGQSVTRALVTAVLSLASNKAPMGKPLRASLLTVLLHLLCPRSGVASLNEELEWTSAGALLDWEGQVEVCVHCWEELKELRLLRLCPVLLEPAERLLLQGRATSASVEKMTDLCAVLGFLYYALYRLPMTPVPADICPLDPDESAEPKSKFQCNDAVTLRKLFDFCVVCDQLRVHARTAVRTSILLLTRADILDCGKLSPLAALFARDIFCPQPVPPARLRQRVRCDWRPARDTLADSSRISGDNYSSGASDGGAAVDGDRVLVALGGELFHTLLELGVASAECVAADEALSVDDAADMANVEAAVALADKQKNPKHELRCCLKDRRAALMVELCLKDLVFCPNRRSSWLLLEERLLDALGGVLDELHKLCLLDETTLCMQMGHTQPPLSYLRALNPILRVQHPSAPANEFWCSWSDDCDGDIQSRSRSNSSSSSSGCCLWQVGSVRSRDYSSVEQLIDDAQRQMQRVTGVPLSACLEEAGVEETLLGLLDDAGVDSRRVPLGEVQRDHRRTVLHVLTTSRALLALVQRVGAFLDAADDAGLFDSQIQAQVRPSDVAGVSGSSPAGGHELQEAVSGSSPAGGHELQEAVSGSSPAGGHELQEAVSGSSPAGGHGLQEAVSGSSPAGGHELQEAVPVCADADGKTLVARQRHEEQHVLALYSVAKLFPKRSWWRQHFQHLALLRLQKGWLLVHQCHIIMLSGQGYWCINAILSCCLGRDTGASMPYYHVVWAGILVHQCHNIMLSGRLFGQSGQIYELLLTYSRDFFQCL